MKTAITSLLFLITVGLLNAQTVSTVSEGLFSDGLGIDSQGNVYGSDYAGDSVFRYEVSTGTVTTFKTGFSNPNGIGVNMQDEIYICDHTAGTIFRYDLDGNELATYTGLITPAGIKNVPGTNDMLFVTYNNSTINLLAEDGTITQLYAGAPLNGPAGIAFINGEVYIGNFNDRRIFRYESGSVSFVAQLPAGASGTNFLGFLSANEDYLLATQIGEHKLYKIDPEDGTVSVYAGSEQGTMDGNLETATFSLPNGILADTVNDKIYVSEAGSKNLRIIDEVDLSIEETLLDGSSLKLVIDKVQDTLKIGGSFRAGNFYTLKVYDALGKLQLENEYSFNFDQDSLEIGIDNWNQGTYIVELTSGSYTTAKKFVKQRVSTF